MHIPEKMNRMNESEAVGAQDNECGVGDRNFKSFRM